MLDMFSKKNEDIILKHMPKFAALESAKSAEVWQSDIGKPFKTNRNGGRKARDIPYATREKAIRAYKANIPAYRIREQLKLSKHALSIILCQAGLRQFPVELLPHKARFVRSRMSHGETALQIASQMGLTEASVQHWIDRYGLDQW